MGIQEQYTLVNSDSLKLIHHWWLLILLKIVKK